MMNIEERVKKVMGHVFDIDPSKIFDNASPDTIKEWTSLRYMNLIIALEEEFGIQFNDQQVIEMQSYPLIVCVVKETLPS